MRSVSTVFFIGIQILPHLYFPILSKLLPLSDLVLKWQHSECPLGEPSLEWRNLIPVSVESQANLIALTDTENVKFVLFSCIHHKVDHFAFTSSLFV